MITVEINSVDVTDQIEAGTLTVTQALTYLVDTAVFNVNKVGAKTLEPQYGDEVAIYDGSTKIFGGTIVNVQIQPYAGPGGEKYNVHCTDYTYLMDSKLASKTYENETIADIIDDLVTSYASTFTTDDVTSTFVIEKIVFNQVPLSTCIKRLAAIVSYDWYVDEEKGIHFFPKYTNTAPFAITDTNGNYVYKTLRRTYDGTQVANRVKVRGGEYDGDTYSDKITVSGNESKSFKLPYRFANLTVTLDTGGGPVSQDVGTDFIDDFTTDDVLYNFQEQMIRFENNLSDGDIIAFTGNPKVPVFSIAEDPISIATYGVREKLIRDNTIESNTVARKRASAELYTYAEPVLDAKFTTYTAGLRAGMTLNISSTNQDFDEDLIIKQLVFKMFTPEDFVYEVGLVSTKRYDFITLLQKILEPEPQASDERETSEEIFTDTQNVNINEEIEYTLPVEDTAQQVTVQENYVIDPLGDETDALYVVAPYAPTSQADTKRPGRVGISLVVY